MTDEQWEVAYHVGGDGRAYIDFICPDISKSVRKTGGGIIEVNAAPGFRMHLEPDFVPRLGMFVLVGLLASYLSRECRRAVEAVTWLHDTLSIVGDAVILTFESGGGDTTGYSFFSKAPEPALEATFGLFMGLVITPGLSDEAVHTAVNGVLLLAQKP